MLRDDSGTATVLALAAISGIVTSIVAIAVTAHFALSHAKAAMVADLAAIASVRQASCASATRVAKSHGAVVRECRATDLDVIVDIEIPLTSSVSGWLLPTSVSATARAGY